MVATPVPRRRASSRLLAGLAGTALALVLLALPAQAAFPGANGRIAFEQAGDIFTVMPDGTSLRRLTATGDNYSPTWSPDGSKIALATVRTGSYDIYVMNADGTAPRRVTTHAADDFTPAWSPTGDRLAFASDRTGVDQIFTISSTPPYGTPRQLTKESMSGDERLDHFSPTWSPDGATIVFTLEFSTRGDPPTLELARIGVDGSNPRTLPKASVDSFSPNFAPSGTKIAFTHSDDAHADAFNVWTADRDGSNAVNLTKLPEFGPAFALSPAWSPDGRSIVFDRSSFLTTGRQGIYIMRADGTGLRRVVPAGENPDWQPL